jgi:hypothetical protein
VLTEFAPARFLRTANRPTGAPEMRYLILGTQAASKQKISSTCSIRRGTKRI